MRPHLNRVLGVRLRSCLGTIAGFLLLCAALFGQEFKPRLTLLGHKARIMCVAVNPDGKLLASGGDDGIIRFWDVASGIEQNTIEVASEWIGALAFGLDGKALASGGSGRGPNTVTLWDVGTHKGVVLLEEGQCMHPVAVFSPDGKILASAATFLNETPVMFWDAATRKQMAKTEEKLSVEALAITSDGKTLVTGGVDGTIKLWTVATGKEIAKLTGHFDEVHALAFGLDGRLLASGGWDQTVRVWDVPSQK